MTNYYVRSISLGLLSAALLVAACETRAAGQTTRPTTRRIKLWDVTPDVVEGKDTDTNPTEPTMDIYLPPPDRNTGTGIVVLPGGGYNHLSTTLEGTEIGNWLVSRGIAGFVVRYRHAPRYHNPIPLRDAQRALRIARLRADEFHISAKHVGVMGFSAGGHLAAWVSTRFDPGNPDAADPVDRQSSRPDFSVLVYPVITFTEAAYVHKGSRNALLASSDEALWAQMSPEQHVTGETPPAFLVHGSADAVVPAENSILYYMACHKNHVLAELHILQSGKHGFGLALKDSALGVWPTLLVNWLNVNKWLNPPKS